MRCHGCKATSLNDSITVAGDVDSQRTADDPQRGVVDPAVGVPAASVDLGAERAFGVAGGTRVVQSAADRARNVAGGDPSVGGDGSCRISCHSQLSGRSRSVARGWVLCSGRDPAAGTGVQAPGLGPPAIDLHDPGRSGDRPGGVSKPTSSCRVCGTQSPATTRRTNVGTAGSATPS